MAAVTLKELAELVGEVVDLSGVTLREEAVIGDDIALDSQEMLRVLSRIEARYQFRFHLRDLTKLKTLGDVLKTIERCSPG